jgi:hypothetical protein
MGWSLRLDVAAGLEGAAAGAGQHHGQVHVRMAVAVRIARSVQDHRVMQQRLPVGFL